MKLAVYQNIGIQLLKDKEVNFLGYDKSLEKYPMYIFNNDYYLLDTKDNGKNIKVMVFEASKTVLKKYFNDKLYLGKIKLAENNTCEIQFQNGYDVYLSFTQGFKEFNHNLENIKQKEVKITKEKKVVKKEEPKKEFNLNDLF